MVSVRIVLSPLLASALLTGVLGTVCPCKYQGALISAAIYNNYPNRNPANCTNGASGCKYPGMYASFAGTKLYGSNCAVWDQMPGTPWHSFCPLGSNWSHNDYNWCQQPWCYVDEACADGVGSSVFAGSPAAFYSYKSCGGISDCYTNIAWNASYVWPTACPYDPTGAGTYRVHKSGACACKFQGAVLTAAIYDNYPDKKPAGCTAGTDCDNYPGQYKELDAIAYYGTTCGSWDQMPSTPWYSYCPAGSEWCAYDWNWCQQPWCYVEAACPDGVASSVFAGSTVAVYSYDTCINTPDCYTNIAWNATPTPPTACPFDTSDNGWYTSSQCPNGWVTVAANTTTPSASAAASTTSALVSSANRVEVVSVTMVMLLAALTTQPCAS